MNNKRLKYSINSTVVIIGAIIVTVLLNAVLVSFDKKIPLKINLVRDDIYKITEETKNVLKQVDKETTITVLYTEEIDAEYPQILKMLEDIVGLYTQENDKIHFKAIDYVKSYTELVPYIDKLQTVRDPNYALIIEQDGAYEVAEQSAYITEKGESLIERVITNKLAAFVDGGGISSVTFTVGHGERVSNEGLAQMLSVYGYTIDQIDLQKGDIPADKKTIVVIDAPTNDFLPEEIDKLDAYLDRGGNVQIYFNPKASDQELPNLENYLAKEWAIQRQHGVAVDMANGVNLDAKDAERYGTISIADFGESEIITPIQKNNRKVAVSASNTFEILGDKPSTVEIASVLKTSGNTYVKPVSALTEDKSAEDKSGSFHLMLSAVRTNTDLIHEQVYEGKLLVSGSSYTMDELVGLSSYANEDLLLNSFHWASGNKAAIMVRETEIPVNALSITHSQYWTWYVLLIVVIPLAICAGGFIVWRKRRHR